jgi:hypothetical protein
VLKFRLLHWLATAVALVLPSAAVSQVQVNQNFVTQGPAPAFGPTGVSRSADAPPDGNVTGAIGPVIADPLNPNRFFIGTVGGGIWTTTNGGANWTPLTDKQATLSISSLTFDPTDPNRNTLIAGTGLTANGTVCSEGPCFFCQAACGMDCYTRRMAATRGPHSGPQPWGGQTVDAVAARGNVLLAGTFEESLFASAAQRRVGGLYRSADGGVTFTLVSGTGGLPTGPVNSIVGDPNNSNRIYAAVSSPSAATNLQTALFVSNDAGVNWIQVFGAGQSNGSISAASQTVLKVASAPGGALAVGVVDLTTRNGDWSVLVG